MSTVPAAPTALWQRGLRAALLLLLPPLLMWGVHKLSQHYNTTAPPEVLRLDRGERLFDAALQPPFGTVLPPAHPPQPVQLPDIVPELRADGTTNGASWYRLPFELAESVREPYLLSLQHRPEAMVFLDQYLVAQSGTEDAGSRLQRSLGLGRQPVLINIAPDMLGAGPHALLVRLAAPGFEGAKLSTVLLGPADEMLALQSSRSVRQTMRAATALAGLVIGSFLLLVWLALRQEWLYGVGGLFCLSVALLLSPYLLNTAPLPSPWWRMVLDVGDVLSKAALLVLVTRFVAWPARWPMHLALAYVLLGVPIDAWAALTGQTWIDFSRPWPWWALGSRLVILVTASGLALKAALRSGRLDDAAAALAVALSTWTWLYVSVFALILNTYFLVLDVNVVGYAALVLLAGLALQQRFVASLREQQRVRQDLEQQVAARSKELEQRFRELQHSEQLRSAAIEREHLLQEMHDGLGSQLLMAKLGAENGLDRRELAALLDDCIDEMRLTVDALSVSDGDLTQLLANLRHRLGSRLAAAGLSLSWQLVDTPLLPCLAGTGGRELVRIVQETLNNVLHHAGATEVVFATQLEPQGVRLSISDNGRGLPTELSAGQGMRNMRKRAARLGAQLSWHAAAAQPGLPQPGTELRLLLPLDAPHTRHDEAAT
nr:ATP-binding protein [uncultured Roseateles sp.]